MVELRYQATKLQSDLVIDSTTHFFNSASYRIIEPNDCSIVIEQEGELKEYASFEDKVLRRPFRFLNKRNSSFKVYYVSNRDYEGFWGGSLQLVNIYYDTKKYYIRSKFIIKIYRPDKAIKLLKPHCYDFTKDDLLSEIRKLMDFTYTETIQNYIKRFGFTNFKNKLDEIESLIEEKVNFNVLYHYGIKLYDTSMVVEEYSE